MLTAKEKIAAYTEVINKLKTPYMDITPICWGLQSWLLHNKGLDPGCEKLQQLFPEFYAQKPDNASPFWWPFGVSGRLIRIDVLEKAIANVKPD